MKESFQTLDLEEKASLCDECQELFKLVAERHEHLAAITSVGTSLPQELLQERILRQPRDDEKQCEVCLLFLSALKMKTNISAQLQSESPHDWGNPQAQHYVDIGVQLSLRIPNAANMVDSFPRMSNASLNFADLQGKIASSIQWW